MREKKCLPHVLDKYVAFLQMLKEKQFDGESLNYLIQISKINKTIKNALIKLDVIEFTNDNLWRYKYDYVDSTIAYEILNYLLELKKKQIVTPIAGLDDETKVYIKEIRDYLLNTHAKQNNGLDGLKTPLLNKALNQVQQTNRSHLFTQIESEQDKKFDLLKAVAGGWFAQSDFITPYEQVNDKILGATDDLFNKFFKLK